MGKGLGKIPDHCAGLRVDFLPEQPEKVYNAQLYWEKFGFTARIAPVLFSPKIILPPSSATNDPKANASKLNSVVALA